MFTLSKVNDVDTFAKFEKQLSRREELLKVKEHEMLSIIELVNLLLDRGVNIETLNGFYYSFVIPQIGKEFDLLRVCEKEILNIELKSQYVSEEKIQVQLIQNKYYLSHLDRHILLYTFIKSTGKVYRLDNNNNITEDTIQNLLSILQKQNNFFHQDINTLFRVSDFLVSPLNTPDKFLKKAYFLTSQQDNFKRKFLKDYEYFRPHKFIGITGGPGTGKTLLLYDLAMECSNYGNCCLIHCGIFSEGHLFLKRKLSTVKIIEVKSVTDYFDFSNYKFVFVDESHRIYKHQFDIIVNATKEFELVTVFSFDSRQTLSKTERKNEIASHIQALHNYTEYKLSDKVRTNKELASFIRRLMNLKSNDIKTNYPSVCIAYANNEDEASKLLRDYENHGFTFINYTQSNFKSGAFDSFISNYNTHRVIGQEFDNVVMLMDNTFSYDQNGRLQGRQHPNPDYLYTQLLYQGLTRVREKLALVIIRDYSLFQTILSILQ